MRATTKIIILATVAAVIAGCTASVRVMPGADGTNRVVARDIEKHKAEKAAFRAAVHYCDDRGMEAVFIGDTVRYEGSMDEDRRNAVRRQSAAASAVGSIARASEHDDAADILESAGAAGSAMTSGKDYRAEVRFVCEQRLLRVSQSG